MADVEVTRPSYYHPLGKIGSRFGRSNKKESKKRDQNKPSSQGGTLPAVAASAAPTQSGAPTLNAALLRQQGAPQYHNGRPAPGALQPSTTASALAAHPALQPMVPTHGSNRRRGSVQGPPVVAPREEPPHRPAGHAMPHHPHNPNALIPWRISMHAPPHAHHPNAPHGPPVSYQRHQPQYPQHQLQYPQQQPQTYPQHQHQLYPQAQHQYQPHGTTTLRLSMGDPQAMPHHSSHGHGAGRRPSHREHHSPLQPLPVQMHHEAYADPLRHSYHGSTGCGHGGSMQRTSDGGYSLGPWHQPPPPRMQASYQYRQLPTVAPGDMYRHQPLTRDDSSSSLRGYTTGRPVVTRPILSRNESLSSFCEEDAMSRSTRSCQTRMESSYHGARGLALDQRAAAAHGYADPLRHSHHSVGSESNVMMHRHDAVPSRELYRQDSSQRSTKERHRCSSKESSLLGVLSNNHHPGESGMGDHSQRSTTSTQSRRSTVGPSILGHVNDMDDRSIVSSSSQIDSRAQSQRSGRRASIGTPDDRSVVSSTSRGSDTSSVRPQRSGRRASVGAPMHHVHVSDDHSDASSISRDSVAQRVRSQRSPLFEQLDPHGNHPAQQSPPQHCAYARSLSDPYDGRLAGRGTFHDADGDGIRVPPANQGPASPIKNQCIDGRPRVDDDGIRVRPGNQGPFSPNKNQTNTGRPMDGDGIRIRPEVSSPRKSQTDKVRATMESDGIRVRPSGPKRTDSDMQSAGIYPEILRSPKKDVRPLVGARTPLPCIPLDMDDGIRVTPVNGNVTGVPGRVERPLQPTRPQVDSDGIRVYSEADTHTSRGRRAAPAGTIQTSVQARSLKERNARPFDSDTDESKRVRSQSGGQLHESGVKVALDQKGRRNSTTGSPPERPRTWV